MSSFKHSSAYVEDNLLRVLPRTLAKGTEAMRAAALNSQFMYPHPGEIRQHYSANEHTFASTITGASGGLKLTAYQARVRVSTLRNVWLDSVGRSALAPIRERITTDGWSDSVEKWIKSVDGSSGRKLQQWLLSVLEEQAIDGIHFALVDLPKVVDAEGQPVDRSSGDDDRSGIRPYAISLCAADVDPRGISIIGGEVVLTSCGVYLSDTMQADDATSEETKTAMWRMYRLRGEPGAEIVETRDFPLKTADRDGEIDESKIGPWVQVKPLGGGTRLDRISIVPFYGNFSSGPYRGTPRFLEPAFTQAGVWRKRSEKDENGRNTVDRIFQTNLQTDKDGKPDLAFGKTFLFTTTDTGSASALYPTGNALEAHRKDIQDDEEYIRAATRSITAQRTSGDVTATEIGLNAVEAGTYQEAVTVGNAASVRTVLAFFQVLGGVPHNGATVSEILESDTAKVTWAFKSARLLDDDFMGRMKDLVLEDKLSTAILLELEKEAGNWPEEKDIPTDLPPPEPIEPEFTPPPDEEEPEEGDEDG